LVDGSELGFGDAVGAAEVEGIGAFGAGAIGLAALHILKDGVDFLLA
jgi:hypothetical protein